MPMRALLIASMVLNIFLAGVIGGGVWHWHRAGAHLAAVGGIAGQRWRLRAAEALPPAEAARFRQSLRQTIVDAQPIVAQSRDSRARAAALFAAPQFDRAATLAELDHARAADFQFRQRLESRIVALAAALPVDERQALASALLRARRGRRGQYAGAERRETAAPAVEAVNAGGGQ